MDRFLRYTVLVLGVWFMGEIQPPLQVKAIFGVLYKEDSVFEEGKKRIKSQFGPIDYLSDEFPFVETNYYEKEMGADLIRRYLSLERLIYPDEIVHFKQLSNLWEEQISGGKQRKINLDPGYVSLSQLVLASSKAFSHRIYVGKGIYAEVTMRYQNGQYTELPWTYPDYFHHKESFQQMRQILKHQLVQS